MAINNNLIQITLLNFNIKINSIHLVNLIIIIIINNKAKILSINLVIKQISNLDFNLNNKIRIKISHPLDNSNKII